MFKITGTLTQDQIDALKTAGATILVATTFVGYIVAGISFAQMEAILGHVNR